MVVGTITTHLEYAFTSCAVRILRQGNSALEKLQFQVAENKTLNNNGVNQYVDSHVYMLDDHKSGTCFLDSL